MQENPTTSYIRHNMSLQPPRVLTALVHVIMSNLKPSFLISCFLLSLISSTKPKQSLPLYIISCVNWSFLGMAFFDSILNSVVPPASLVVLAFAWPTLCFINACEWVYNSIYSENMEDKVVIITGASSGMGEVKSPFFNFFFLQIPWYWNDFLFIL